jgi:hypothetical protein
MAISQKADDHIKKVMGSSLGPIQKWKSIRDMLLDAGIAYSTTAKASAFIVHPKNRSGALISPHGCHRKSLQIMKAGADISLLKNSVAMELNPSMQEREKQVQPFLKLTESTQLLSPVLGTERYASLSSGHTCQFIKACMHGCPTEEEALGGVTGKLGTHVWEHDHDLKKMVEVGWEWVILPHTLDVKFPKLAELIQHALNTPNSVFGTQSEFELAASIWEVVSSTSSKEVNWDEVSTSCCSGGLTQSYANTIGKFVKLFSGTLALA